MFRPAIAVCTFAMVVIAGCGGDDIKNKTAQTGLPMERLSQGEECRYQEMKPDFAVRADEGGYNSLWKKLFSGDKPAVDMKTRIVLLALLGQHQGSKIEILSAEAKGEVMEIKVRQKKSKSIGSKQTSPFDLAAVQRVEGVTKYKFIDSESGDLLEETKAY